MEYMSTDLDFGNGQLGRGEVRTRHFMTYFSRARENHPINTIMGREIYANNVNKGVYNGKDRREKQFFTEKLATHHWIKFWMFPHFTHHKYTSGSSDDM